MAAAKRKPRAGRRSEKARKDDKKAQNAPRGTKSERERETIERVLSVGAAAKVKLYHGYLSRIGRGEILKPSELKYYHQLETDLEAAAGNNGKSRDIFLSARDAEKYIGKTYKTIYKHVKNGNLKQNPDGTFSREELDKWIYKHSTKNESDVESIKEQQEKAELRYRLARAKREEILTAEMQKNLVTWEEVERSWAERVREVHIGLDAFADRLPALLVGRSREEIHRILKSEARELCDRYDREGRYCPECGFEDGK